MRLRGPLALLASAFVLSSTLTGIGSTAAAAEPVNGPDAPPVPDVAVQAEPTEPSLPHRGDAEPIFKSTKSDSPAVVRFVNRSGAPVQIAWLDASGRRRPYWSLPDNTSRTARTFVTHAWLITDEQARALSVFVIDRAASVALIERPLRSRPPSEEAGLRSIDSKVRASVRFVNQTRDLIRLYWIDYDGRRDLRARVPPSQQKLLKTFVTHPWLAVDHEGRVVAIFQPREGTGVAVVEDSPASSKAGDVK